MLPVPIRPADRRPAGLTRKQRRHLLMRLTLRANVILGALAAAAAWLNALGDPDPTDMLAAVGALTLAFACFVVEYALDHHWFTWVDPPDTTPEDCTKAR